MVEHIITDVSAEGIVDTAKVVAKSPTPLSKEDIVRSFEGRFGEPYVQNCIIACLQLKLIAPQADAYVAASKYRSVVERAHRSELNLVLRSALQDYPPFLLFADFVSKGYPADEACNMTRGILHIESSTKIVLKSLRLWGIAAGLVRKDQKGNLTVPDAAKGLPDQYVKELVKALQDHLKANIFLVETLSPQVYGYLTEKGISISELAQALVEYEKDSEGSADKSCKLFEQFLYKFGEDVGAPVKTCNGIIELTNAIKGPGKISKNQSHLCDGIGGLRNMSIHGPDKETGNPWTITPQGALVTVLSAPALIRSIYLYSREKKQEY